MKRYLSLLRFAALAGSIGFANVVSGNPGDLDIAFGAGKSGEVPGTVVIPFTGAGMQVYDVAAQSDLKIVAAGIYNKGFCLARCLVDGMPDPEFGSGGMVLTPLGVVTMFADPVAIAIQTDGKIVIAGSLRQADKSIILMRYLPNGTQDVSFGDGDGKAVVHVPGTYCSAREVVVLGDGKILVGGSIWGAGLSPAESTLLCRFHPDGSEDESFGPAGRVTIPNVEGDDIKIQLDGKIIAAGVQRAGANGENWRFWLARCNADGTLDSSFGTGGTSTAPDVPGATFTECHRLALQEDGKIVVVGRARFASDTNYDIIVARFDANGNPDPAFNGTGMVITNLTPGPSTARSDDSARDIRVQSDGKLIVAGEANGRFALVRYLPGGQLDDGFGDGGMAIHRVMTLTASAYAGAYSMMMRQDGRVITGGGSAGADGDYQRMALARYLDRDGGSIIVAGQTPGTALEYGQVVEIGSVPRGSIHPVQATITIRNNGTSEMTGITASITGIGAGHFTVITPPAAVLSAGGSTVMTIEFTPLTTISSLSATLMISGSNPYAQGMALTIQGSTVAPVAELNLLLGNAPVARDSTVRVVPGGDRVFTIRNTGNVDLMLQAVSLVEEGTPGEFVIGAPEENLLAPGALTVFPVSFSLSGNGPHTARLRLVSTDTLDAAYEINLAGDPVTALDAWRRTYFGSPYDEGVGAASGDPDGDGLSNLLEYATFNDPTAWSGPPGALRKNGNVLEYTFTRPSAAAMISYQVEWSDSLLPDSWSHEGVTMTVTADDGVRQTVKCALSAGSASRRFVRLRASL